jgi:uncharacterized protein (TIGR04222 family)
MRDPILVSGPFTTDGLSAHADERQRALWQRLRAHDFAPADDPLHFTARLAREHGWSLADAAAAVEEYRRFCFLAAVAGHGVTPSSAIDEVWHLHLTYTREYWSAFCPDVLGFDLHHEPTRGRLGEGARFRDDYARTLASYETWFGAPPERWWPGTHARFADTRRWRRVDLRQVMVLPRPRLAWFAATAGVLALALTGGRALAQDLGPLDLAGESFLTLYLVLAVVAFVVSAYLRRSLRGNAESRGGGPTDPIAIAYLVGGAARATDAAATELLYEEQARWNAATGRLELAVPVSQVRPALQPFARTLATPTKPATLISAAKATFREFTQDLQRRGLLLDDEASRRARFISALPFVAVAAFGLAKVVIGIAREKPVMFLAILVVLTVIAALWRAFKPLERSRAGDSVALDLKRKHARVARAPLSNEMALAVALGGTMLLSGTAFASYHQARAPQTNNSGDSSSSSSSGDSGSSDSGDSGGGGGCGGCGGGGGD